MDHVGECGGMSQPRRARFAAWRSRRLPRGFSTVGGGEAGGGGGAGLASSSSSSSSILIVGALALAKAAGAGAGGGRARHVGGADAGEGSARAGGGSARRVRGQGTRRRSLAAAALCLSQSSREDGSSRGVLGLAERALEGERRSRRWTGGSSSSAARLGPEVQRCAAR